MRTSGVSIRRCTNAGAAAHSPGKAGHASAELASVTQVDDFGQPPQLQVVLQQPFTRLLPQRPDLGTEILDFVTLPLGCFFSEGLDGADGTLEPAKLRRQLFRHREERTRRSSETTNLHAPF